MHVGNVFDWNNFIDSNSGFILVGTDDKLWGETIDDKAEESVLILDFGSGEIVAFAEIAFDPFVFGHDINIVLSRCGKIEIVALNKENGYRQRLIQDRTG